MRFINRTEPLAFLNREYAECRAKFIAIYGKRRVGKTELVKQFFADKPHIYFLADKTSAFDQLKTLSAKMGEFFRDTFVAERGFGNWEQVFAYLKNKGQAIWVIDEFPYLVEADPAIPSLFQKGWDEYLKNSQVFLILLGSSIGMMETEVLGYRSPLYGRRTGQLLLNPMDFADSRQFFPRLTFEDALAFYAVCGGVPAYLLEFKPQSDLWTNIRERVLALESFLYREPEFLLREELREPRNYFAILKAMAAGKAKIGELVNETGFPKSKITKYLSVLTDLKIVERQVPVTEDKPEKSKRGIYRITDHFSRFWFEFVFPYRGDLEEGETDAVLRKIKQAFPLYLSTIYEDVARELTWDWLRQGKLPFRLTRLGRYWEKDAEIDLVGLSDEDNVALFGEVKWPNKPMSIGIYEQLKQKAQRVNWRKEKRKEFYMLFSRSGFSDVLRTTAQTEPLFLVEGDRLL
ncbi:MAG: ATP-binding protein [Chloroflexota bacterium]